MARLVAQWLSLSLSVVSQVPLSLIVNILYTELATANQHGRLENFYKNLNFPSDEKPSLLLTSSQ